MVKATFHWQLISFHSLTVDIGQVSTTPLPFRRQFKVNLVVSLNNWVTNAKKSIILGVTIRLATKLIFSYIGVILWKE